MGIAIRAVWGPSTENGPQLAKRLIAFLTGVSDVEPRLSAWKRKGSFSTPLLANYEQGEAEALLSESKIETQGVPVAAANLGYLVAAWTGEEGCGAQFDLVLGASAEGIHAPNSLNLSFMGRMDRVPLKDILDVIVKVFDAYAADVTTDAFLDAMLDAGESIVAPSGGLMAYAFGSAQTTPSGCRAERWHRGTLLIQDGAHGEVAGMNLEVAAGMHEALLPWRDGDHPEVAPSPR